MKILIMSQFYAPEPAPLMVELAHTLQDFGHDVEILTGFPNYPTGEIYEGYKLRPWQRETIENIPVTRVLLYPDHSRKGLLRVLNYGSFALSCLILAPFLLRRPDVIFAKHPPLTVGLPAIALSKLWRVPFLYRVVDMWPETLSATGMINSDKILNLIDRMARAIYGQAAEISVISPGFRANLIEKGVPPQMVQVVTDWADSETYYPAEPDPLLAAELGLDGRFNIMFAGNIGKAQGLETVLEAAELTQDLEELQFVFVGDGIERQNLQEIAREREITNVRFLGRYPKESMADLYALADVLLVHLRDDPLFRITIPHKVYAYLASGKPILVAVRGDAANVIAEAGAGLDCIPEDPAALAAAVREFVSMPEERRNEMAANGLRAAREQYSRTNQIAKIERQLKDIARQDS